MFLVTFRCFTLEHSQYDVDFIKGNSICLIVISPTKSYISPVAPNLRSNLLRPHRSIIRPDRTPRPRQLTQRRHRRQRLRRPTPLHTPILRLIRPSPLHPSKLIPIRTPIHMRRALPPLSINPLLLPIPLHLRQLQTLRRPLPVLRLVHCLGSFPVLPVPEHGSEED